jgi:hypothetical protein
MEAAQAQKHVTHNDAIRIFDQILNATVLDKDLATPPGSPAAGASYIIAASPTGAWVGKAFNFVSYLDGAWQFIAPVTGLRVYVADEALYYRYSGTTWVQEPNSVLGATTRLAQSANGAFIDMKCIEQEITVTGAFTDSTILIPDRGIVLAVATRVTQAITGATSYSCGVSGTPGQFGSGLGITLGSNNVGAIGPTAFYANTAVRLTAAGANFTGGKVRIAIQYFALGGLTS